MSFFMSYMWTDFQKSNKFLPIVQSSPKTSILCIHLKKHWLFSSDQFFWNYYYDLNILYSTPLDVTHGSVTTKHLSVSFILFSAVEALCAVVHGSQVSLLSFYEISFCFSQSSLYLYCRNFQAVFACWNDIWAREIILEKYRVLE